MVMVDDGYECYLGNDGDTADGLLLLMAITVVDGYFVMVDG